MTFSDCLADPQFREMLDRVAAATPGVSAALTDLDGRILLAAGAPALRREALAPLIALTTSRRDPAGPVIAKTIRARRLTLRPLSLRQGPGAEIAGFLACGQPAARAVARDGLEVLAQAALQHLLDQRARVESLATEVARSYEEVTLFHRFFRELGGEARDLDRLCAFIGREVEALLPVRYLSVMLVDDVTNDLYTRLAWDRGRAVAASPRVKVSMVSHLFTRGAPTHVRDLRGYLLAPAPARVSLVPQDVTEALFVPLVVKTRVIGLLTVALKDRPFSTADFGLLEAVATGAAVGIENTQLMIEMHDLFVNTVTSFVQAIGSKDDYTAGHSTRVARHVQIVAEEMGLPAHFTEQAVLAALLHDVGKIGTPDAILGKPATLTSAEWVTMKQHPDHGHTILKRVPQLAEIAEWVRHEHERYDGHGYPDGLAREAIPIASRIIAVADAFDAMTTDRIYRKGMPAATAIERLRQGMGSHFDPDAVEAFIAAYTNGRIQTAQASVKESAT